MVTRNGNETHREVLVKYPYRRFFVNPCALGWTIDDSEKKKQWIAIIRRGFLRKKDAQNIADYLNEGGGQ